MKGDKKVVDRTAILLNGFDLVFDFLFLSMKAGPFLDSFKIFLNLFLGVIHNPANPWESRLPEDYENAKSDI